MTRYPPDPALDRFLLRFALAYAGGVTLYMPLLTLLLPLAVAEVAGEDRFALLAQIAIAGSIAASLSNIAFGWLSDGEHRRHGGRRRWMAAGLALTLLSYGGIALAASRVMLLLSVLGFQIVLNMLLAPLMASMADSVPDRRKGLAGGLLALAQPVAALVGAAVTGWNAPPAARLALVAAVGAALVLPMLLVAAPVMGDAPAALPTREGRQPPARMGLDMALLWMSRLLVQVAATVLFGFLLFLLAAILGMPPTPAFAAGLGQATAAALVLALPVGLLVGRLSDRAGARKPALLISAAVGAAALMVVAGAQDWWVAVTGYAGFVIASTAFLGLQSAYAMQMLPSAQSRGRDLGLINLANTLPSFIGPLLTWGMAEAAGHAAVLGVLAALTLAGGLLILPIRAR